MQARNVRKGGNKTHLNMSEIFCNTYWTGMAAVWMNYEGPRINWIKGLIDFIQQIRCNEVMDR